MMIDLNIEMKKEADLIKSAIEDGVELGRINQRYLKERQKQMEDSYRKWQWEFLGIEEVGE